MMTDSALHADESPVRNFTCAGRSAGVSIAPAPSCGTFRMRILPDERVRMI